MATSEFREGHQYYTDITEAVANYDRVRGVDVEDKMFLPDVKQVYTVYENREILGDDYYIGEPTDECVENSDYKSDEIAVGSKWRYWLRVPEQFGDSDFRCVDTNGEITTGVVNRGNHAGIRPAFYLKQSTVFKSGLGTDNYPYSVREESIKLGEYMQMGTYYGEPIIWRCVDIDENGPLMLSDKILTVKAPDANGSYKDTGSHSRGWFRGSFGSNYWPDSNICSWLNSEAEAGKVEWLCGNPPDKSHVGGYNAYDQEAGFLNGFALEEIDVIKKVTQKFTLTDTDSSVATSEFREGHQYYTDITEAVANYDRVRSVDVEDKMFIPDVKQVYAVYENRAILGDDYYVG